MSYDNNKKTVIEEVKLLLRITNSKAYSFNIKGDPAYKYNAAFIKPTKDVDADGRTIFATLFCDVIIKGIDPQFGEKDRVLVTGSPSLNQYTGRDGVTKLTMVIWADSFEVTEKGSNLTNNKQASNQKPQAAQQSNAADDDGFEEDVPF